jgi:hypothetical protein
MKLSLRQMLDVVRVWLGWGDLSKENASPAHGWLLPTPTLARVQRTTNETARRSAPEVFFKDRG